MSGNRLMILLGLFMMLTVIGMLIYGLLSTWFMIKFKKRPWQIWRD